MLNNYRRYRHENQYDAPLLIFLIDSLIGLGKIALGLGLLAAMWFAGSRYLSASLTADAVQNKPVTTHAAASLIPAIKPLLDKTDPDIGTNKAEFEANKSSLLNERWVFNQRNDHFTIQFGSSPNIALLKEFIPAIDNGSAIALYPYKKTRNGRLVYGLATGVYNDLDTALETVDKLPEAALEFGPWIRPIKELKEQINRTVGAELQEDRV